MTIIYDYITVMSIALTSLEIFSKLGNNFIVLYYIKNFITEKFCSTIL